MCEEGEGDCNKDGDCAGRLVCGNNNCGKYHDLTTGMWDEEDDCCERQCTPEKPCKHGEGLCESDADCDNSMGRLRCGTECLNQDIFPRNLFPLNSETFYTSTEKCCYRVCNRHYRCSLNQVGCWKDEDCQDGLYCNKNGNNPYCADIDECQYPMDAIHGHGRVYCGVNSHCHNLEGSFDCECWPGYTEFKEYDGCVDRDECLFNAHDCEENAVCYNTRGSYECLCPPGYTGDPSACTDLDECANPAWNSCSGGEFPDGIDTETIEGMSRSYPIGSKETKDISDGEVHTYQFSLAANNVHGARINFGPDGLSVYYSLLITDRIQITFCNTECTVLIDKALDPTYIPKLNSFNLYYVSFEMTSAMQLTFGIGEDIVIEQNIPDSQYDSDPFPIEMVQVMNYGDLHSTYWRHIKKREELTICKNNIGSYLCVPQMEKVAIGTGGLASTYWRNMISQVSVITKDKVSCLDHGIPETALRRWHGKYLVISIIMCIADSVNTMKIKIYNVGLSSLLLSLKILLCPKGQKMKLNFVFTGSTI